MIVSIDSFLASRIKPQVFMMAISILSFSEGSEMILKEEESSCFIRTSVSTRFFAHPKETIPILEGMDFVFKEIRIS
jgi:hypothetical protein